MDKCSIKRGYSSEHKTGKDEGMSKGKSKVVPVLN
jgi:hypothetical protein